MPSVTPGFLVSTWQIDAAGKVWTPAGTRGFREEQTLLLPLTYKLYHLQAAVVLNSG